MRLKEKLMYIEELYYNGESDMDIIKHTVAEYNVPPDWVAICLSVCKEDREKQYTYGS